jgi:hypothetical protein
MPSKLYEETDWLASLLVGGMMLVFLGIAAVWQVWPLLFPAGLMLLMAISLYCRTTVTLDELSVRFGVLRICALRLGRLDVLSAEVYDRKWDGVNFQVRRIADVATQRGGNERGVLLRSGRGDFWVQSRQPEQFVQALVTGWGLPPASQPPKPSAP